MINYVKNIKLTYFTDIQMKTFRIAVILFFVLAAFACSNQQSKNKEGAVSKVKKQPSENSLIKKIDKIEEKELKPCEDIVTEILITSPRYMQLTKGLNKAVVKNGGQFFEVNLERSPNPNQDKLWSYSRTYDFTVYEMYIERKLNIARFSFDPNDKQLYEYDAIMDQITPIEFDRNLLLKYEVLCK